MATLMEMTNTVALSANIIYHARIICQKYMQRPALKAADKLISQAYDCSRDIFEVYANAYKDLKRIDSRGILKLDKVNTAIVTGSKMERQKRMVGTLLREGD